ncbi:MAG TPA: aldehyde dehydrogenase family protein [Thermoguttaceae bacterium]|nr:aldehyde dehydrogenase family protein [Thermoguttaceae bacterium]
MKMFIGGQWVDRSEKTEVTNPFDGSVIDTVPKATAGDVDAALAGAVEGARTMRNTPAYERSLILRKAAELMHERREELARTISSEEGKVLAEGRVETSRAIQTFELSAEESKRLGGEVLPLDGAPGCADKLGFTIRVPCGVVVAISPFNFPLNLVSHKVAPALAAGNAVVLKPASDTPLVALRLVEILLEAGLPPLGIACLTGSGAVIGDGLCADPRVRKISFTGSRDVGEHITQIAGLKKITMELGSNCPVVVMDDADLAKAAELTTASGYSNAGQVCISAQRVLVMDRVHDDFLDALVPKVEAITTGNQLDESTRMGPMIRESDAVRVEQWVDEAVSGGARLLCGGERQGRLLQPMLVAGVDPGMRISCEELFGPAMAVTRVSNLEEAIRLANNTNYGLSAAIFTESVDRAMRFAREVDAGSIHVNWGTSWRADAMPYGGLKESGFGKEGPKYAIEEMTEMKAVVLHGLGRVC